MSTTKYNHMTPKFLIKNFDNGSGVYKLSKRGNDIKIKQTSVKRATTRIKYFDQNIENTFARYESDFSLIIKKYQRNTSLKILSNTQPEWVNFRLEKDDLKAMNLFFAHTFFKPQFKKGQEVLPSHVLDSPTENLDDIFILHYNGMEKFGGYPFVFSEFTSSIVPVNPGYLYFILPIAPYLLMYAPFQVPTSEGIYLKKRNDYEILTYFIKHYKNPHELNKQMIQGRVKNIDIFSGHEEYLKLLQENIK